MFFSDQSIVKFFTFYKLLVRHPSILKRLSLKPHQHADSPKSFLEPIFFIDLESEIKSKVSLVLTTASANHSIDRRRLSKSRGKSQFLAKLVISLN